MPANFWSDATVLVYIAIVLVCWWGAGLFFYWLFKKSNPSPVYIYVTFMLFGEGLQAALALYARFIWITGDMIAYKDFLCSWAWHSRTVITLLACSAMVFHMTYRAITNKDLGKRYHK